MNQVNLFAEPAVSTEGLVLRKASLYDGFVTILTRGKSSELRTITLEQARLKSGESILDVGCGTGGVTIPAKNIVGPQGTASGLDPSSAMIAVAREKASRQRVDIKFTIGVIEQIPYPDASFDAVTASLMMHHLPEELQKKGIAEIYRVLKPGGRVIVADALTPQSYLAKQIFGWIARRHGVKFGVETLPAKFKAAGFVNTVLLPVHFRGIGFVRGEKPVLAHSSGT